MHGETTAVAVYHGIVRGRTVLLPSDAELADDSVVEVRLAHPVPAGVWDDAVDQQVQAALMAAGLLLHAQPLGARSTVAERPLLQMDEPSVSATIIAERR
jgi:hypothetical protein